MSELTGYKGEVLKFLTEASVSVGDVIQVKKDDVTYEGVLMPRYELADDVHLVIKLKNGYNIGIQITSGMKVIKVGAGTKPAFVPPPLPAGKSGLPKVGIVSTGGTIASRVDYRTGAVRPALSAQDLYSIVPELSDIADVRAEILFRLFSEDVHAPHWAAMAKAVAKHIADGVDGVVICHGTDTMGYTAAALSFALQNLPVPVIIVGSQRSSDRPSSDAAMNLMSAVFTAARAPFAEVAICMHEGVSDTSVAIHRGTKVRKCHTSRRDAFESINVPPLAQVESGKVTMLATNYIKRDPSRQLILKPDFDERVALIKSYPGINPKLIDWLVDSGYLGIIFEGTGLGHVGHYLFQSIKHAADKGVVMGMTSQCIWGRVNMNVYDTGMDLQVMGVIPLEDMLPETALAKFMWIFGQTKDPEEVKKLILTNIAGEISPRTIYG